VIVKEETKIYLAGLIDGDGCLTISLTKRDFNIGICITPNIRIAWRENAGWLLEELQKETGLGRVYYSNRGKPNGICCWQTTNTADALLLAKLVLPYLRFKKDKCQKFIEIVDYYQRTSNPRGHVRVKAKGKRLRKRAEMEKIIKVAISLNYDRQVKRYREYHGWSYWQPIIHQLYKE
jgi:hypothetical protein